MSTSSLRGTRSSSRLSKPIDSKDSTEENGPTRRSRRISQSDDSVGSAAPSTRRSSSRLSQISEAESMESLNNITTRKYSTRSKKSADSDGVTESTPQGGRRSSSRLSQISESTESLPILEKIVTRNSISRPGRRSNSRLSQFSESSENLSIADKDISTTQGNTLLPKIDEDTKGDDSDANSRSEESKRRSNRLSKIGTPEKKTSKSDVGQPDNSSPLKEKTVEKLKESKRLSNRINKLPTLEDIEEAPNENIVPTRRSTRLRRESETSDTDEKTTPVKTRGRKSTLFITLDKIPDEEEEEDKMPKADDEEASPLKVVRNLSSVSPRLRTSLRSKNDKNENDNKLYNLIHSEIKRVSSNESLTDFENEEPKDSENVSKSESETKDSTLNSENDLGKTGSLETEPITTDKTGEEEKTPKMKKKNSLSNQISPSATEQLKIMKCVVDLVNLGSQKKLQSPKSTVSHRNSISGSSPVVNVDDCVETRDVVSKPEISLRGISDGSETGEELKSPLAQSIEIKSKASPVVKSSPLKSLKNDRSSLALEDATCSVRSPSSKILSPSPVKSVCSPRKSDNFSTNLAVESSKMDGSTHVSEDSTCSPLKGKSPSSKIISPSPVKSVCSPRKSDRFEASQAVESSSLKISSMDKSVTSEDCTHSPLKAKSPFSKIITPSPVKSISSPRKTDGKTTSPKSGTVAEEVCNKSWNENETLHDVLVEEKVKVNSNCSTLENISNCISALKQEDFDSKEKNTSVCDSPKKSATPLKHEDQVKSDENIIDLQSSDESEASVDFSDKTGKSNKRLFDNITEESNSKSAKQSLTNGSSTSRRSDGIKAKVDRKSEVLNKSKLEEEVATSDCDNQVIPLDNSDNSDADDPELITLKYSDDDESNDDNNSGDETCSIVGGTDTIKPGTDNKSAKQSKKSLDIEEVEELTPKRQEVTKPADPEMNDEDEITSNITISDSSDSETNDVPSKLAKKPSLSPKRVQNEGGSEPSKGETREEADSGEEVHQTDKISSDEEKSMDSDDSKESDSLNKTVTLEAEIQKPKAKSPKRSYLERLNDPNYVSQLQSYISDVLDNRQKLKKISKFKDSQENKLKLKKVTKSNTALLNDRSNVLKIPNNSNGNKNVKKIDSATLNQPAKSSIKPNQNKNKEKSVSSLVEKPLKSALKKPKISSEILQKSEIEKPLASVSDEVPNLKIPPAKKNNISNALPENKMLPVKNLTSENGKKFSQDLKRKLPSAEIMNGRKENSSVSNAANKDGVGDSLVLSEPSKKSKKSKKKEKNQKNPILDTQIRLLNKVAKEKGVTTCDIGNRSISNILGSVTMNKPKSIKDKFKDDKSGLVRTSWGKVLVESQPQNTVTSITKKLTDPVNKWEIKPATPISATINQTKKPREFIVANSSVSFNVSSQLPKANGFPSKSSSIECQVEELSSKKKKKKKKKKTLIDGSVTSSDIMKSLLNKYLEKNKVADPAKKLPLDKTDSSSLPVPQTEKDFDSEVEVSTKDDSSNLPSKKKTKDLKESNKVRKLSIQDVFSKKAKVESNPKKESAAGGCPILTLSEKERLIKEDIEKKRKLFAELEKRTPTPIKKFKADQNKKFAASSSLATTKNATAKSLPLDILEKLSDQPLSNSGGSNLGGESTNNKKRRRRRSKNNKNRLLSSCVDMKEIECLQDNFIPINSNGSTKFKLAIVDKLSSQSSNDGHFKSKQFERKNLPREPAQDIIAYRKKMKNLDKPKSAFKE